MNAYWSIKQLKSNFSSISPSIIFHSLIAFRMTVGVHVRPISLALNTAFGLFKFNYIFAKLAEE